MSWDEEYDIISVGSGIGGLACALTAAEHGASSVVLEKFDKLGGTSALSSGQLWLGPNHLAETAGIKDDYDTAQAYINHLSQGLSAPQLRNVYFERARETLRFFTDTIGIEMMVVRNLPDYYYPAVPGSVEEGRFIEVKPFSGKLLGDWSTKVLSSPYGHYYSYTTSNEWVQMQRGGENIATCLQRHVEADERCAGAGLAAAQVHAALKRGVEFRLSTEVVELVLDEGKVTGVVIRDSAGTKRIGARLGVLLATGGYDWRTEFVRSFDTLLDAGTMSLPTVTGDHINLASKTGAIPIPARAPSQSPIFVGYRVPSETIFGQQATRMWLPGNPHCIVVNKSGQRFANDAFYPDVVTKVGRFDGQEDGYVNWPAWMVFDQNMLDKYGLLPTFPGQELSEGVGAKEDSLLKLAEVVGIDADGLQATVERFNVFCESGVDKDFARGSVPWGSIMTGDPRLKNPNMAEIARAPFYAVKLCRVTMGVPTAGLPIDSDGRVLTAVGSAVPGLYASGNSAAWQDWGGGYNSGIAGMRGLLYGHQAACHMTAQHPHL